MTSLCTGWAAQYRDGEHRLEYKEEKAGEVTYVCKDCGETVTQFQDTQGG